MKVSLQTCAVAAVPLLLVSCSGANAANPASPPTYNPYPSGILPADVESETARVQGEVQSIFQQALAEGNALPPANVTGQPPTQQASGYRAIMTLGKLMNYDLNMSALKNMACASCHMPYAGFGDRSRP
jgi:cytochrome c peroxidase